MPPEGGASLELSGGVLAVDGQPRLGDLAVGHAVYVCADGKQGPNVSYLGVVMASSCTPVDPSRPLSPVHEGDVDVERHGERRRSDVAHNVLLAEVPAQLPDGQEGGGALRLALRQRQAAGATLVLAEDAAVLLHELALAGSEGDRVEDVACAVAELDGDAVHRNGGGRRRITREVGDALDRPGVDLRLVVAGGGRLEVAAHDQRALVKRPHRSTVTHGVPMVRVAQGAVLARLCALGLDGECCHLCAMKPGVNVWLVKKRASPA